MIAHACLAMGRVWRMLLEGRTMFRDRQEAGRRLAERLTRYADRSNVIVLALPRGGVPVAFEVARRLRAPLDVFVVRKLGLPGHEELAMGALASGGTLVINDQVVDVYGIPGDVIESVAQDEAAELARREAAYRGDRPVIDVAGRTVILVDDGLATGATMRAAVEALRKRGPERIVAAVPVGSAFTCAELASVVDDVVCVITPEPFYGVGAWYSDFGQTTDEEVRRILATAWSPSGQPAEERPWSAK